MKYKIALFIILAAALGLRLWPIRANLPYAYWLDENNYIEMALRFGSGNFRLTTFSHGALYQLILFLTYLVYYAALKAFALIGSPQGLFLNYLKDPTPFFLIARSISAASGLSVIYVVWRIAKKIYGDRTALIAAVFSSFTLLLYQMSFLALADMPSVFLLVSAFSLVVDSIQTGGGMKRFYAACLLVGLATACKFYAAVGIVFLCVGAILLTPSKALRTIVLAAAVTILGFAIGMPQSLLNPVALYKDSVLRMGSEYILNNPHRHAWLFLFKQHLPNGLGIPLSAAVLMGIAASLYRRSRWDILLLSAPLASYILTMRSIGFAYHLLPAIPFLMILAAKFMDDLISRFSFAKNITACLITGALVVAPSFSDCVKYAGVMRSPDTRSIAARWIEENIPAGATILCEGYIYTAAVYGPPLSEDMETLKRDLEKVVSRGGSGSAIRAKIQNYDTFFKRAKRYDMWKVERLSEEDLSRVRPSYVILADTAEAMARNELSYYLPDGFIEKRGAVRAVVTRGYELIKSVVPSGESTALFPHLMNGDYDLIKNAPLFGRRDYVKGPRIDIYMERR